MGDKPILFSGPMVRALINGSKTQTRRLFKPQPEMHEAGDCTINGHRGSVDYLMREIAPKHWLRIKVGDRLYVRETWAPLDRLTHNDPGPQALADRGFYQADGGTVAGEISRWTPAIHQPRWASRLTLTVTEVRVERLQDISDQGAQNDCTAEGIFHCGMPVPSYEEWHGSGFRSSEKFMYRQLWEAINGPGSWDANPWVAAYTFTVQRGNIDQLGRGA